MMLFQNPIVWFLRIRKRKGYGVHSPFAFSFVTDVLYNKEGYYAYAEMDRNLHWWQKARVRSMRHLAFRLANFHRPKMLYCRGVDRTLMEACHLGSKDLTILDPLSDSTADMIFLSGADEEALRHIGEGTMMVVKDVNKCPAFWKRIMMDERVTVTFDLYDVGIAFARKDLNKEHYKINW